MINPDDVVSLSRLQFGATALFHFLFVPLPRCQNSCRLI